MGNVSLEERLAQMGRELREELAAGNDLAGDFFCRMGKLMAEHLLKAEVADALGRGQGERREAGQAGYRNGYKARTLRTGEGRIEVDVPQVRGLEEPYRSPIWQGLGRRSVSLEKLAKEMYARGLSTRDIEDLLKELSDDGQTVLLSRSSVSGVTEALWQEYEAFTKRDLSAFDVVYLFADAVHESLKQQAGPCTQAVLVSWGILRDGSKVLLHMSLGNKESGDSWLEHFRSLVSRGLPTPLTVTTDGAPGLIKAIEGRSRGDRGDVARGGADPLLGAQDAQRAGQGPRRAARDGSAAAVGRPRRARSPDGPAAGRRVHRAVQGEAAQGGGLLRRGSGGEPEPPEAADAAPQVDPHDQPGRTRVRGGATAEQGDPEVPDREGVPEAGVRGAVAGQRAVAEGEVH